MATEADIRRRSRRGTADEQICGAAACALSTIRRGRRLPKSLREQGQTHRRMSPCPNARLHPTWNVDSAASTCSSVGSRWVTAMAAGVQPAPVVVGLTGDYLQLVLRETRAGATARELCVLAELFCAALLRVEGSSSSASSPSSAPSSAQAQSRRWETSAPLLVGPARAPWSAQHRRRQRRLAVGLLLPVVLVLATARGAAGVEPAATAGRSARPRRSRPLPLRRSRRRKRSGAMPRCRGTAKPRVGADCRAARRRGPPSRRSRRNTTHRPSWHSWGSRAGGCCSRRAVGGSLLGRAPMLKKAALSPASRRSCGRGIAGDESGLRRAAARAAASAAPRSAARPCASRRRAASAARIRAAAAAPPDPTGGFLDALCRGDSRHPEVARFRAVNPGAGELVSGEAEEGGEIMEEEGAEKEEGGGEVESSGGSRESQGRRKRGRRARRIRLRKEGGWVPGPRCGRRRIVSRARSRRLGLGARVPATRGVVGLSARGSRGAAGYRGCGKGGTRWCSGEPVRVTGR